MPTQGPLRWLDGEGWLILSGGGDWHQGETDAVDAQLLSVANLDRPMLVLTAEGSRTAAEELLEHFTALGGPGGEAYSLELVTRDYFETPGFITLLMEAGILVIDGANPLSVVNNLVNTEAFRQIVESFSTLQGLTIMGSGAGAAALGHWVFTQTPPYQQALGFGFVMNAVVVPHFTRTEDSPVLRALPQIGDNLLGLGIPERTALALGPEGQVEMWGEGQVTAVVSAGNPPD